MDYELMLRFYVFRLFPLFSLESIIIRSKHHLTCARHNLHLATNNELRFIFCLMINSPQLSDCSRGGVGEVSEMWRSHS